MPEERTLPELTKDFAANLGDLFRNEVRLARAETIENLHNLGGGLTSIALGIAVAAAAITLALFGAAYALALIMPQWAAAFVVAAIGGIVAYSMVKSGRKALSADRLAIPRTARQVASDLRTLKEHVPS